MMRKRILAVLLTICMGAGLWTPGEIIFAEETETAEVTEVTETVETTEKTADTDEVENELAEMTETAETEEETEDEVLPTGLMEPVYLEITDVNEDEIFSEASLTSEYEVSDSTYQSAIYDSYWDKYSTNYFYNQLSETERTAWDAMDALCLSYLTGTESATSTGRTDYPYRTQYVTISDLDKDSAKTLARIFRFSNPQYYFLTTAIWSGMSSGNVVLAFGVYTGFADGTARATATAAVKEVAESWVNTAAAQTTEAGKVKVLHDLVVDNVDYNYDFVNGLVDEEDVYSQSAYSVFCTDLTVCAGYAQAFSMVCNASGIDCISVTSSAHQWNKVRINDSWYNVDCTWADSGSGNATLYEYFERSDTSYANDSTTNVSNHTIESYWSDYLPSCTLDSSSSGYTAGTLPDITETTEEPVITYVNNGNDYTVTITDATSGAIIYYTVDGTTPSPSATKSYLYTDAFTVESIDTVWAVAVSDAHWDSEVVSINGTVEDDSCLHTSTELRNAIAATCITAGYTGDTYCADCGELLQQGSTIAATGHTVVTDAAVAATCTTTGLTEGSHCSVCGTVITAQETIAATGHTWDSGTVTTASTVKAEGVKTYTCTVCGATKTEAIAKLTVQYKVKFDGNESTSGSMDTQTITYGSGTKLTANAFKRKGYSFNGWNTKADGSGTSYSNKADGSTLLEKSGTITLYAQWKKTKYTITYKLNGGKNNSSNPDSYKITTSTIKLKNPTRKGYKFAGWYSDKKCTKKVTQIKKGSTGNKTLYAKWTAHKYTIKFDGNGSTSGSMDKLKNRKYGRTYTLTANAYKKKGYTFTGWNTKKDGSGKSYKNKAEIKNLTSKSGGTVTLYAQWKKTKYTITYKLNGGKNNSSNPDFYKITTSTIKLKNPTRKGYKFAGWYSDKKCTKKVTQIKKGSTGNKTLYAKWKKK